MPFDLILKKRGNFLSPDKSEKPGSQYFGIFSNRILFAFLITTLATEVSFAQTHEYLVCTGDTFTYPQAADNAWYHMNFGDGNSDSGYYSIKHVFAKNGKYNVLVQRTLNNNTDTIHFAANVGSLPKPAFEPAATCYFYKFQNQIPDTVEINGGFLWNFGDGANASDPSPSHLYQAENNYKVSLQYARKNQCSNIASKTIVVSAGFYPGFDYHSNQNEAIFLPLDTSETHYHWNFGDHDTTDSISPVHTFRTIGTFPVSLVIKSNSGCETFYTDTISVTSAGIQPLMANSNLFAAYPNPFKNSLVIHYEIIGSKNVILKFYDVTGKLALNINEGIRHTGRYDLFIDPTEYRLRAGMYILNAYFDQEYLSQKLVME
jgi:PKD repeat protein